jgi:ABC-type antimicrobial peptide transport system permease subunit
MELLAYLKLVSIYLVDCYVVTFLSFLFFLFVPTKKIEKELYQFFIFYVGDLCVHKFVGDKKVSDKLEKIFIHKWGVHKLVDDVATLIS